MNNIIVYIIGCPIKFSIPNEYVFLDYNSLKETQNLLAAGKIFTHPVLGNMTPERFEIDPKTNHIIKVFCHLMDNKKTV